MDEIEPHSASAQAPTLAPVALPARVVARDARVVVLHSAARESGPAQAGGIRPAAPGVEHVVGTTAATGAPSEDAAGAQERMVRCEGCNVLFKQRGLAVHKRSCDRKRAVEAEQRAAAVSQTGRARPLPPLPPPPVAFAWAREVDLGTLLLPDGLSTTRRIPRPVRRDLGRALATHMRRIVADPTDEASWTCFLVGVHMLLFPCRRGGSAGIRELRQRIRRFEEGQWSELMAERHQYAEVYGAARADMQPVPADGVLTEAEAERLAAEEAARRRSRAHALGREGELSRAVRALQPSPPAPDTDATEAELRRLHPPGEEAGLPQWLETFVPATPVRLDRESFRESLRTAPRRSAPAGSGLRYEHLKDLCLEDEELFELLFSICSVIAEGRISRRVAEMLTTGRLFAMAKLRVGGVRPIAVGESLLRLTGRALARQYRAEFQRVLEPFQFGVATPGGCEAVVHGIRAYLELHPDHIAIQVYGCGERV